MYTNGAPGTQGNGRENDRRAPMRQTLVVALAVFHKVVDGGGEGGEATAAERDPLRAS